MFLGSKGCAFGLLAVFLYQFKNKHLSELQWWFQNIEKADYLLCTPNAKILHNPVHASQRVRILRVMGIEKTGGTRTEAEPKSHINRQIRLTHARVSRDLNWVQQQPKHVRS